MTFPIYSVSGTANQISASPSTGQVIVGLPSNVVTSSDLSCPGSSCNGNLIQTNPTFQNLFTTNPGTNGFALSNDGSGAHGNISWISPPATPARLNWNSSGGALMSYQSAIGTVLTSTRIPVYFAIFGNATYITIDFSNLANFVATAASNILYFTTFNQTVNSDTSMPTNTFPIGIHTANLKSQYLGTVPIYNNDTGDYYNAVVIIKSLQGNGFLSTTLTFLPGGTPVGGGPGTFFSNAPTLGYAFGYNSPPGPSNPGQQLVTFTYINGN